MKEPALPQSSVLCLARLSVVGAVGCVAQAYARVAGPADGCPFYLSTSQWALGLFSDAAVESFVPVPFESSSDFSVPDHKSWSCASGLVLSVLMFCGKVLLYNKFLFYSPCCP